MTSCEEKVTISSKISYKNMKILAPMVRVGTLPMRLLALKYGADLVYCEEIIDHRFTKCSRVENAVLDSVDFIHPDGNIVFRTCEKERGKVVFQMGTADPDRALQAAKMIEQDVAAIDVNMGCPKDYSIKGGMGAALLKNPEKIRNILTKLVEGISKPVTCKIRILPTIEETLNLARIIQDTKVAAVAVHGREQHERPRDAVHKDVIREVARTLTIPVICNGGSGDIKNYEDMERYQNETETASVMVARAAQWNPSVFRKEGPLPFKTVIEDYIKCAIEYENTFPNTKYCLAQLMHDVLETEDGHKLKSSKTMKELCDIWDLGAYLEECKEKHRLRKEAFNHQLISPRKRKRNDDINEIDIAYNRNLYGHFTPKCILLAYTRENTLREPYYQSVENAERRLFNSVVTVNGKKYTSSLGGKSKKSAEQQAALACLNFLGIDDKKLRS